MRDLAHKSFSRKVRLTANSDFQRIYRNSEKISGKHFTLLIKRNSLGYARLGLSISKKRVRHAAARNRLKRIVRESFRHVQAEFDGIDIIAIANKGSDLASNQDLFASLEKQWVIICRNKQ